MKLTHIFAAAAAAATLTSCDIASFGPETPAPEPPAQFNHLYLLSEGQFGSNNSALTRISADTWTVDSDWYLGVNGEPLGDTGNDIAVIGDRIVIAVNGSNIIEVCDRSTGKSLGSTEAVPGCRRIAPDPTGEYAYVTSYADDGYVAKLRLSTMALAGKCRTGYEPEGVVYHGGNIFVANTGGNAWDGSHSYETTVSVIDAATMTELKRIDTGLVNLYGGFVQNDLYPRYIMVNACGDYYASPAGSCIFDCESQSVVAKYDFPATYVATHDGKFYVLGSSFSYATYAYEYTFKTIDMASGTPVVSDGILNGDFQSSVASMTAPYGLAVAPDGEFFVTDAGNYASNGILWRFSSDGALLGKTTVGVCPGHFAFD